MAQSNTSTCEDNIMAPPVLMSVTKEEREKSGYSSFREWIEDSRSVYIGANVRKYAPCHIPSHLVNPFYGYYQGEKANKLFESFIRCFEATLT